MVETNTTKYTEAFDAFAPALSLEEIDRRISEILQEGYERNNTREVKKFLHSTIDLTTLAGADTEEKVAQLVGSVNDFEGTEDVPSVAAICVYPNFVKTVREVLTASGVQVACVSGAFPASQSFTEVKIAETALAIAAGADEIDIVLNLGAFLSGDYLEASTEIEEQKATARGAHLKVILETGALKEPELIRRASILALFSGADFLKTSTGKEYPGADLRAAYILCSVLREYKDKYGEQRGVKFSGGIRSAEEAVKYYTLVEAILGKVWLDNRFFRIGASSLVGSLQQEILG
ncbi:deoxyribose-phosphate aldolase [Porphyromonas sp. oral taxon 278 str. W7784]|uniref:deoxyribose-phosphate aldolase n=1 Tax=Porphyromonas sp. oral taxon 278 TaxID=712437 RepID=UPI0003AD0E2F|nr:deoxyribose-phosphate aldolase [Porphyromonas sp. oral taxon 278]ERJ71544.1 deoxyribose-phosphate aldolase [Porphyromonas sp. oral taxon 278 str. W7784]